MLNLLCELLVFLPKNTLSRWIGAIVTIEKPRALALWLARTFAGAYQINQQEAEYPIENYPSLAKYFIRRLKPGGRPVDQSAKLVHCADAVLTQRGVIAQETLLQAKGRAYSLNDLLQNQKLAARLEGGWFGTYYLCPTDYHRVHSPASGAIHQVIHVPGKLWPVNNWSVQRIESLFAVNERLVIPIETTQGLVVAVMVGATNVGKMSLAFDENITTNLAHVDKTREVTYANQAIEKGQELGVFHMGSTVILCVDKAYGVQMAEGQGITTRVGQKLI